MLDMLIIVSVVFTLEESRISLKISLQKINQLFRLLEFPIGVRFFDTQ